MAMCSLPMAANSFSKMVLPLESRKSSSVAIRSSNVPFPTPLCKESPNQISNNGEAILRRSANFKPSIWTYDYIQSLSSEYKEEKYVEQGRMLREEARMMLGRLENPLDQLELIDVLQRLGIDYHFGNEIKKILDNIYNTDAFKREKNLYATALEFRLLRQHGYDICTDVFVSFQDVTGNFKKNLSIDIEGILSLYEASFHLIEEETILDEAKYFTSQILKEYLNQNRGDHISLLISHALEFPLHWRIPRWEAQWFINAYEGKPNMNPVLLQLAKLDFNFVQAIYHNELKYTSRWWNETGFTDKLSFSRDRLVENFFWTMGTNFKPDFGYYRREITKVNSLIITIDDIYDVYGTLDELELFTAAVDRWDLNAMDGLPDYMKTCFHTLHKFVDEMALETLKKNGHYITPYLKKGWTDLCKAYLIEAKWYCSRNTPSLREYLENAWISISAPVILVHAYFLIPHSITKKDLVYLEEYSDIIRFSGMILRLANDLGTYKRENESGDVPKTIQCYMSETGATEGEACEYIKSMLCTMWKKMNKEARNSSFSQSFIDTAINLARMALCIYQHGDGYTIQDIVEIRNRILSLIVQPIPIICTMKK